MATKFIIIIVAFLHHFSHVKSFAMPKSKQAPSSSKCCTSWTPQDLTKNNDGFLPIPDDDYIKMYRQKPELWPVEFFIVAYRRLKNKTQILVRRSANGTSKYGLGTGVPATRWILSSASQTPKGYEVTDPVIRFDAKSFPEFPKNKQSWTYTKIHIRQDAFRGNEFEDPELEEYATKLLRELRKCIELIQAENEVGTWKQSTYDVIKQIVDNSSSVAALQGSLRMSGLFALGLEGKERIMKFGKAPDPSQVAKSCRVYTMFPQMPCPLPPPSATPEELRNEILTRKSKFAKSGRNPHMDQCGRIYTHISTSNVSNTIHGIYLPFDVTGIPGLDDAKALDLFGVQAVDREWVSLHDLKVLDGKGIGFDDTKPTFISGFIVRQLVKEGVIPV